MSKLGKEKKSQSRAGIKLVIVVGSSDLTSLGILQGTRQNTL